ncbi:MAG: hypothetical protein ABJH98_15395 [Reichenbachiella sp.]|uniref:hypothetical protein n=1 Tax=Reichenbachiella sp. TaxID=2184521 RepID=UPI003299A162
MFKSPQAIFETISISFDLFDEAAAFPDNSDMMSVPDLSPTPFPTDTSVFKNGK